MRAANLKDLPAILAITKETVEIMAKEGNPQWDETYPNEQDFRRDILEGSLFVFEENEEILGFICLNLQQPKEYQKAAWSQNAPATVLHRTAVSPAHRGKGTAKALFAFAKEYAIQNGTRYIRTDTHSSNEKMNALMLRCGFVKTGEIPLAGREGRFFAYEWVL